MPIINRMVTAWNAFLSPKPSAMSESYDMGPSSHYNPSSTRPRFYHDRSIISSIYMRLAMDVAGIPIRHIEMDENNQYKDDVDSTLNSCLTIQPNMDQIPRAFFQDVAETLFDKGCAAIVPVDYVELVDGPRDFDVYSLRVGEVVKWFPSHVRVSVYNEKKGYREEVTLEKRIVALIQNPLYAVMNEPNGTLQRLIRKLQLSDGIDEQSGSGKLDMIIQLPYVIKSEARQKQAEERRQQIEFQLRSSKYGIAYTDGTEKVTQLNRPVENNLMKQIEVLTAQLYTQLGLTDAIMNGTADESAMLNYYNRTIEPILDSIVQAMRVAFVGGFGKKSSEKIAYFRDPFKLVPLSSFAEIVDKFTRNEVASSNEMRGFIGLRPSKDPKANMLINSNMPQPQLGTAPAPAAPSGPSFEDMDGIMNKVFGDLGNSIDKLAGGGGG